MIKNRLQRRGKRPPLHVHQWISQFIEAVVWPASRNKRKKPKKNSLQAEPAAADGDPPLPV